MSYKDAYDHGETNAGLGMVAEDTEIERLEEKSRRQSAELLRLNQKLDNHSARVERLEGLLQRCMEHSAIQTDDLGDEIHTELGGEHDT